MDQAMRSGARHQPELELIVSPPGESLRWFTHDYPFFIAWRHHPEYELHLIRHGRGALFCGDYVGEFTAGQIWLIGPNIPHQWASHLSRGEIIKNRDVGVHFRSAGIDQAGKLFPKFGEI